MDLTANLASSVYYLQIVKCHFPLPHEVIMTLVPFLGVVLHTYFKILLHLGGQSDHIIV